MVGPSSILTARKASLGEWRARTESHDLNGRLSLWRCGGWGGMSQLLERVSHPRPTRPSNQLHSQRRAGVRIWLSGRAPPYWLGDLNSPVCGPAREAWPWRK